MEPNFVLVLDYLKDGYPDEFMSFKKAKPVVLTINTTDFSLIEACLKEDKPMQSQEKFDINYKTNDVVERIKRIPYDKLTTTAKTELEFVIETVVKNDEEKYIKFYNLAQPMTSRMHVFELLAGIGKKNMWTIIDERKMNKFESYVDFQNRVKLDPVAPIVKKIIEEIKGESKHNLFIPKKEITQERKPNNNFRRRF
ncbi:MAG: DUF655 domain-containing protein [Candidatus Nanoarchaeia archaeon]|nr:DUF655 domain-containing protein [Candidatus Nanoarchaeia archaeon]